MRRHVDDYPCGIVRSSFQETAPRKTAENTVKHRNGRDGSVLANHGHGGESLVIETTLMTAIPYNQICTVWKNGQITGS